MGCGDPQAEREEDRSVKAKTKGFSGLLNLCHERGRDARWRVHPRSTGVHVLPWSAHVTGAGTPVDFVEAGPTEGGRVAREPCATLDRCIHGDSEVGTLGMTRGLDESGEQRGTTESTSRGAGQGTPMKDRT